MIQTSRSAARRVRGLVAAGALLAAWIGAVSPASGQAPGALELLLAQDVRLASVGERLLKANAALCRTTMPVLGMILHGSDQYRRDMAGTAFANGPLAVAAVVPGSPAARVLAPGDGLAAIGSTRVSELQAERGGLLRNAAFAVLAALPADRPIALTIVRAGQERVVELGAEPGCRALIELEADTGLGARSDGTIIQVNYGLAAAATDEQLAVVFAHEMAHLVLEHRRRLEQAGVVKGIFGELGSNQQRNREAEVEADRMTVHLLVNAGYDPQIAPAFWRSALGRRAAGGLLRNRIYPSPEARARLVEREIADFLGGGAPSHPGHLLARRGQPGE
jgi:hypothetical protein